MADKLGMKTRYAAAPAYEIGQPLPISDIRTDGGTQARAGLNEDALKEYAEAWLQLSHEQNGFLKMPLIVVFHDGEAYWLADGFHRVEAYKRFVNGPSASASPHTIRAEIRSGTRRDAVLYACGANSTHGLKRTTEDKRRAIERVLRDEEWRQWSDSEIARRVNVDHKTVAAVRAELYPGNSQDSRTVERGGTTYQQKPPFQRTRELPPPEQPNFAAAQQRAAALSYTLEPHKAWYRLVQPGGNYEQGALDTLLRSITALEQKAATQPTRSEVAPAAPAAASPDMPADQAMLPEMPAPAQMADLPPEYAIVQRRLSAHGVTLTHERDGRAIRFALKNGIGGVSGVTWEFVLNRLSLLEDGMDVAPAEQSPPAATAPAQPAAPFWQSMAPNHPTAHLWTRTGMNEHHAACGMVTQRTPSGSPDVNHCTSCVRATWPQNQTAEQPKIPEVAAPVAIERAHCSIDGCDLTGVGTHQIGNQGVAHWFCDQHAPIIAALNGHPRKPVSEDSSAHFAYVQQMEAQYARLEIAVRALLKLI